MFKVLKEFSFCWRLNVDYYLEGFPEILTFWPKTMYPAPVNYHNETDISSQRFLSFLIRNPEASPDYTA